MQCEQAEPDLFFVLVLSGCFRYHWDLFPFCNRYTNLNQTTQTMPLIETNGIKFNYEERGSGEPLICIMGVTAPGGVWDAHAQAWESHFRCILGDNRGVGLTDKPEGPYTTAMMADDYAGLMDKLGIKQDFLRRPLNVGFSGGEKKAAGSLVCIFSNVGPQQ